MQVTERIGYRAHVRGNWVLGTGHRIGYQVQVTERIGYQVQVTERIGY